MTLDNNNTTTNTTVSTAIGPAGMSVWATAQGSPAGQRRGKYHPDSAAHPAKMLPAIVQHAVRAYTRPGDLVLDPMCGIGTSVIESLHLGRRAVGVEYEPRWAQIARANIALARDAGVTGDGEVYTGDARTLPALLPPQLRGQVDLVITSPPYGASAHGRVNLEHGVRKFNHRYGTLLDRGQLANVGLGRLLSGFTRVLTGAAEFLAPGGHVVITARPWRQHAELVNLPAHLVTCGTLAGLTPTERCVALLGRLAEGDLIARSSFWQRDFIVKNRRAGLPVHLIAHEDVIVLQKRESSAQSLGSNDFRAASNAISSPSGGASAWADESPGLAA